MSTELKNEDCQPETKTVLRLPPKASGELLSTQTFRLPPLEDLEVIETEYGFVSLKRYNHQLTEEDIASMLTDIASISSNAKDPKPFFNKWNLREFYWYNPKGSSKNSLIHSLLSAAIEIDCPELAKFIYRHLVYDDKFNSLDKVKITSVRSRKMRDFLILRTLRFGGDYEEELGPLREGLRKLKFD